MNSTGTDKMSKKELSIRKEKRDIRIVFLIFSAIFGVLSRRHYPSSLSYAFMGVVLVILPLAVFAPALLRPAFKLWMKLVHAIGWLNTQVILTIVFILIIIPTGLIMKIMRKDPMKRKRFAAETYWEPCELEGLKDRNRYERQF